MRYVRFALLLGGIGLVIYLVTRIGTDRLVAVFAEMSWWQFLLVCLPYGFITVVDTLGWRFAFARDRAPFHRLIGARIAGEALNLVTAVASVGGEAVKAWLIRRDVPYEESVPAVVIAKTTITIAQALFLLFGIGVALTVLPTDSAVFRSMLGMLAVEAVAVGGFFLVQVIGVVRRGGRWLAALGATGDASYAERLDLALREFYLGNWRRVLLSTGFHFAGWVLGAIETYLIMLVLGIPVSLPTATVIEAFGTGVRFATFMVPASFGTFEGANTAAFASLGLGASAGLAYSLVRRGRQGVWIVIGLVVLVAMRSGTWLARTDRSAA